MVQLGRVVALWSTISVATIACAQEVPPELVTDRPDLTESASIVPAGWWQFETGILRERNREEGSELRRLGVLGGLLRVGLSESLEARLAGSYVRQETRGAERRTSEEGLEQLAAGGKVRLADNIALLFHLLFPFGHPALRTSRLTPEVVLAIERDLSGGLELASNLGGEWRPGGPSAFATVTAGFGFAPRLGAFIELFGEVEKKATPFFQAEGGFTYLLRDNLQLDFSAGAGIFEEDPAWYFGVGLSVRFPR